MYNLNYPIILYHRHVCEKMFHKNSKSQDEIHTIITDDKRLGACVC